MEMILSDSHYTYNASAKTITLLSPYDALSEGQIVRIKNLTRDAVLYDCGDLPHDISLSGAVITFTYPIDNDQNTDKLQIVIDQPVTGGSGSGETNTASNQGAGGVGPYYQKAGVDLQFKNINAGSPKITVTDDPTNHEIDIDVDESNIKLDDLGSPDDNTDLDASTTRHGLLKKLDNNASNFMNGQGNWSAPPSTKAVPVLLSAESAYLPATNPAAKNEAEGVTTFAGWAYLAFDDTTSEHAIWRFPMRAYDGGDIIVTAYTKPATTPTGPVTLQFNILTIGLANSEAFDSAITVDTGVNISQSMDTTELNSDVCISSATIDPANVAANDLMVFELSRDVASDTLVGDGQLLGVLIEYSRS